MGKKVAFKTLGCRLNQYETDALISKFSKQGYKVVDFSEEADAIRNNKLGKIPILYPLGIRIKGGKDYFLRNAVAIKEDGSIVCHGDIPQGSQIHLMIGGKESCKQAAKEAAQEALENTNVKR